MIISVYKNMDALELILQSLANQQLEGSFEVIIAEDNDSPQMRERVVEWKSQFPFSLLHVSHADRGFRKCVILNQAVLASNAPYLIFVDGDCICHPKFIAAHLKYQQGKCVVYGRRAMLSKKFTEYLYKTRKMPPYSFVKLWLSGCSRLDAALYLPLVKPENKKGFWGHNWSIQKTDLMMVHGFDEQYTQPGIGEDTDIEWRLEQFGVKFLRVKNLAVQYHLWHNLNYQSTTDMESVLTSKKQDWEKEKRNEILMGSLRPA
ncbi:MAG: glycosyltransferase [Bacteroidia bacterium]|nr:glycosyltransferase [Bacteroidia bacterium]